MNRLSRVAGTKCTSQKQYITMLPEYYMTIGSECGVYTYTRTIMYNTAATATHSQLAPTVSVLHTALVHRHTYTYIVIHTHTTYPHALYSHVQCV